MFDLLEIGLLVTMFLWGSLVGSYAITVQTRVKAHEKIRGVPSHCMHCGKVLTLRGNDLWPIFTYLIRRGNCKYCGINIGSSTLVYEVSGGLVILIICLLLRAWGVLEVSCFALLILGMAVERTFLRI